MKSLLALLITTGLLTSVMGQEIDPATRNIHQRGDFSNLAAVIAETGSAHVVTLGGSITQNTGGHSKRVPEWLAAKYPECDFTFTNAGLSSTCSTTGAFRLERFVLEKGPVDLLIVEFAVNDDQDAMYSAEVAKRGMEGIVRRVRGYNPNADILMVQYVNPAMLDLVQRGETPVSIAAHEVVAEHYGITSVDVAGEVADATEAGRYTWDDYGGTHPAAFGYEMATNLMTTALDAGLKEEGELEPHPLPKPLDPQAYDAARWIDPQVALWLGGWKLGQVGKAMLPVGGIRGDYEKYQVLRAEEPGSTLYFNFRGRAVGAFVLAGPDAGMAEYSIDNGEWKTVDFFHKHSAGLNYPRSVIFADDLSGSGHQLALRVAEKKNEKSSGNALSILFFEVNE